ncbi:MAG: cupin domain-containing protein [Proteobacteria bacterium]|nr:cupin domain-containing protein [Pseudomonadota bacterium]HQR04707.1 cupin domain-containing protein [Rhodocyclaceae bacterium]
MIDSLLGGLTPRRFLRDYWQKKPLLIQNAIHGFTGLLDKESLLASACRDDVESRLVSRKQETWTLDRGPFCPSDFRRRKEPWTILVQGVNLFLPAGDALLRNFDFIPHARLDDLMISYATEGGGVGPHTDNYDVFLLQGMGRRRWRIGKPKNLELLANSPLKVLKDFHPVQEWVLEPGDMLYLPPQWAHDGIAEGECMTYSIGFRTDTTQELAEAFLTFLQERLDLPGRYADPHLAVQQHPGRISAAMVDQVTDMLDRIRWNRRLVGQFLGGYLTEPKHHVFFDPPEQALSLSRFTTRAIRHGLRLDLRTRLLYSGRQFYINGESAPRLAANDVSWLADFADRRSLPEGLCLGEETWALLYDWYCAGFIVLM